MYKDYHKVGYQGSIQDLLNQYFQIPELWLPD
jgi:hypothetical protein